MNAQIPPDEFEDETAAARPDLDREIALCVAGGTPTPGAIAPVRLAPADTFCFSCHRGIACWNACCHGADVTLTPYDILRLSGRLGLRPAPFLERHTVPAVHEQSGMPVAKLKMSGEDGKGLCFFAGEAGCAVYADRPLTCRYYPLGLVSHKLKEAPGPEDFHVLVKEPHCRGHAESRMQTVAAYRAEQGVADYEAVNRGWVDILMKLASWASVGGPMGKAPSQQARQMFFMVSTDVDRFRRFVFETRFLNVYDVPAAALERIRSDDVALLQLGFDWLKNVLFNERTLAMQPQVLQAAVAKARSETGGS